MSYFTKYKDIVGIQTIRISKLLVKAKVQYYDQNWDRYEGRKLVLCAGLRKTMKLARIHVQSSHVPMQMNEFTTFHTLEISPNLGFSFHLLHLPYRFLYIV